MKAVGIKTLKAHLSTYVRQAKAGETILVTDRDEVVAQLVPPRHRVRPAGSTEEVLDSLAEQGQLTRASLPKRSWSWRPRGLGLPIGTAKRILDDLRSDRDER
jgi:prevent-host-death family protein